MGQIQTLRSGETLAPEEIVNFLDHRILLSSGVTSLGTNLFCDQETVPAMSVKVNTGYAYILNSTGTMAYPVAITLSTSSVAISANNAGNTRIDTIVLYIDLGASANSAATNVAKLIAVQGTPGATPTAPSAATIQAAIGSSNPYIILANITVGNGVSSILTANVSDQRSTMLTVFSASKVTQIYGPVAIDTDGATVTLDCSSAGGNRHQVTLGGNRALQLSNYQSGQMVTVDLIQDSTGSRTISQWPKLDVSNVTITIATPGVVTLGKDIPTGTPVIFTTTGALPTGITAGTIYYWIRVTSTTGQLATSFANAQAGTVVATSGTQSGTHTCSIQVRWPSQSSPTLSSGKYSEDTIIFYVKDSVNFNVKGYTGGLGF